MNWLVNLRSSRRNWVAQHQSLILGTHVEQPTKSSSINISLFGPRCLLASLSRSPNDSGPFKNLVLGCESPCVVSPLVCVKSWGDRKNEGSPFDFPFKLAPRRVSLKTTARPIGIAVLTGDGLRLCLPGDEVPLNGAQPGAVDLDSLGVSLHLHFSFLLSFYICDIYSSHTPIHHVGDAWWVVFKGRGQPIAFWGIPGA